MAKSKNSVEMDKLNSFQIVEAYKNIRMNLLYSLVGSKNKAVIVSSSIKNEGKTTTAANLAMSISQNNAHVLLIDADLRKSRVHKLFRIPNQNGLSTLIIGQCTTDEAITKNVKPDFDVMTAGAVPPNPSELLGSARMREILDELSGMYDYIIIDTPPINIVSDALTLVDATAGVLLISRQKFTQYNDLQRAVDSVKNVNGRILGVVINDVKRRYDTYYHNYYSYRYEDED